jgi:hypothetical protein
VLGGNDDGDDGGGGGVNDSVKIDITVRIFLL